MISKGRGNQRVEIYLRVAVRVPEASPSQRRYLLTDAIIRSHCRTMVGSPLRLESIMSQDTLLDQIYLTVRGYPDDQMALYTSIFLYSAFPTKVSVSSEGSCPVYDNADTTKYHWTCPDVSY